VTSTWNVGEILCVFDMRRRKWISEEEFRNVLKSFVSEVMELLRLRVLEILPILTSMLVEAWPLILREHIYEPMHSKFKYAHIPIAMFS